jgi:hypothetical protein
MIGIPIIFIVGFYIYILVVLKYLRRITMEIGARQIWLCILGIGGSIFLALSIINQHGGQLNLSSSNLWKLLPRLIISLMMGYIIGILKRRCYE